MLERFRRRADRRKLIVYVDTISLELAVGLSVRAAARGIDTALVCGVGQTPELHAFARVVETDDFGIDSLRRIVRELAGTWAVAGITTTYGPFRPEGFVWEAVSVLGEEYGVAHSPTDAVYRGMNKYLARDALQAAGLPVGNFAMAGDPAAAVEAARRIGLPVVLKPVTGVGSTLIRRCRTEAEVAASFAESTRLLDACHYPQLHMAPHRGRRADGTTMSFDPVAELLVEEYFPGREASVECLVVDDEVVPLVVHDKVSVEEREHVVLEHVLLAPPERFTPDEVAAMEDYATRAVRGLGLRWCFCHVELRYVDGMGPRLLEVNPRIGAGAIADSIETFWGIDVGAVQLDLVLGGARVPVCAPRSADRHAMSLVFSPRSGVLRRLDGLDDVRRLPEVKQLRSGYRPGDPVGGDLEEIFLASVWMEAADGATAMQLHRRILDLVDIDVEPVR